VFVCGRGASLTFTCAATGGTATFVSQVDQAGSSATTLGVFTAVNVGASITGITVTPSASVRMIVWAQEYSGVDNTTPMDVTPTGLVGANSVSQISASITPVTNGALVLTGFVSQGNSGTTTPFKATTAGPTTHTGTQAGTGWTAEMDLWNQGASTTSDNLVVSSNGCNNTAGAYECDWTAAVSGSTGVGTIALRPAAGAATPTNLFFQMF
jgi:hypothetical protein